LTRFGSFPHPGCNRWLGPHREVTKPYILLTVLEQSQPPVGDASNGYRPEVTDIHREPSLSMKNKQIKINPLQGEMGREAEEPSC